MLFLGSRMTFLGVRGNFLGLPTYRDGPLPSQLSLDSLSFRLFGAGGLLIGTPGRYLNRRAIGNPCFMTCSQAPVR
jgi:hypothetical protein